MNPKILLAIEDAGSGHRRVAEAIQYSIEKKHLKQLDCETVDFYKAAHLPVLKFAPNIYDHLSQNWITIYDFIFRRTNNASIIGLLATLCFRVFHKEIMHYLFSIKPELIVVANPTLISHLLNLIRRRYKQFDYQIVTLVTDLVSLHAAWDSGNTGLYIVPTEEAYIWLQRNGVHNKHLVKVGYPVHDKFNQYNLSKTESRRILGIDENKCTILLTGGGAGAVKPLMWILDLESLFPDCQFLVVTGKNHKVYEILRRYSKHPFSYIFGYVNNMETYMGACDIVISKAGPSTIMESKDILRPLIITGAMGLQEYGNIEYVKKNELGFYCPTIENVIEVTNYLMNESNYRKSILQLEMTKSRIPNGSDNIANILIEKLESHKK